MTNAQVAPELLDELEVAVQTATITPGPEEAAAQVEPEREPVAVKPPTDDDDEAIEDNDDENEHANNESRGRTWQIDDDLILLEGVQGGLSSEAMVKVFEASSRLNRTERMIDFRRRTLAERAVFVPQFHPSYSAAKKRKIKAIQERFMDVTADKMFPPALEQPADDKPTIVRQYWTTKEENTIRELRNRQPPVSWETIAADHLPDRTVIAMKHKWGRHLKGTEDMKPTQPWSDDEVAILIRERDNFTLFRDIAVKLGRSQPSVEHKMRAINKAGQSNGESALPAQSDFEDTEMTTEPKVPSQETPGDIDMAMDVDDQADPPPPQPTDNVTARRPTKWDLWL